MFVTAVLEVTSPLISAALTFSTIITIKEHILFQLMVLEVISTIETFPHDLFTIFRLSATFVFLFHNLERTVRMGFIVKLTRSFGVAPFNQQSQS
jgi:hypothetical protein